MTITPADLDTARHITTLADEGGTIQPERLISVMRDPRDHRTMSLREAWSIILPHLDASEIGEALWG
jgi:hypothetical protein